MLQNSNLNSNSVMDARDHIKNGASLKSQTSKNNEKIVFAWRVIAAHAIVSLILIVLMGVAGYFQEDLMDVQEEQKVICLPAIIENGDTIPNFLLPEIYVYAKAIN